MGSYRGLIIPIVIPIVTLVFPLRPRGWVFPCVQGDGGGKRGGLTIWEEAFDTVLDPAVDTDARLRRLTMVCIETNTLDQGGGR